MTTCNAGWTRTTITLALDHGIRHPIVAEAMGHLAIHAPHNWDGRVPCPVQISHIPTGWLIGTARTDATARAAVMDLMQAADWSFSTPAAKPKGATVNPIFDRHSINTLEKQRWY